MRNTLFALLALISALLAAYFLYHFQHDESPGNSAILGIVFAIVAVVFGGLFAFNRVNTHDEIHVTE